jgi:hypothetical protein
MHEPARPSDEAIRERAYEISLRADGGTPEENWKRAEEELRDDAWTAAQSAPDDSES